MDNLAGAGGGPHDPGMEMRLQRLEDAIPRSEALLKSVDDRLRGVETEIHGVRIEVNRLGSEVNGMRSIQVELAEVKGRVGALPTTWAMLTAIMAGQITFAGVFAAVLRLAGPH
jgi:hypothetical protein